MATQQAMRKVYYWNVYDEMFVKIGEVKAPDLDEAMQQAARNFTNAKHILRVRP